MNSATNGYLEKWGLLPLRFVVALVFFMHGGQKVLDFGVAGVADMLTKLGFVYPTFFAVVLMIIELAGAFAILFGLFTRIAGFVLAVEMAIAIYVARLGGGFFTPYGFRIRDDADGSVPDVRCGRRRRRVARRAQGAPGRESGSVATIETVSEATKSGWPRAATRSSFAPSRLPPSSLATCRSSGW